MWLSILISILTSKTRIFAIMKLVTLPETSLERFLENRFQSLSLMTEKTMGCCLLFNQEFEIFCQVADQQSLYFIHKANFTYAK